ncbi:DNA polymerase III subunit gamma/tau [Hyphobacterium sp. HN65]|uniref:DNA polymerase III subunit gamma/tau n=1 Tax=Hyphobacterium lacteum TaxID=3116575 RepID=A0ABU7LNL0_9PROT|nr:DNA polymerase III subunit gamma/tau [Hyphobacterium sp. HN65]MEE2525495.1 DNA polymerase III subunit gamma/tau [Hyphobacterium sp. HN65]
MDDAPEQMTDTDPGPSLGLDLPEDDAGYQVLARKYRPTRFEDLIGQEAMVRTLTNAFKTGRIAHAYMLTGVRGVGKTTTARLIARALNYLTDDVDQPSIALDPPGVHCEAIQKGSHVDVMEMDAASRTGVGDIREILEGVRYAPVSARYKVYVIDEVHMLSNSAFNALLKTLEEPPPHVKFIFATTEIRKVPVTVLSRCQRFDLKRVDRDVLTGHLDRIAENEGASVAEDGLALIARAAEGSVRDALSLLDQAIVQGEGEDGPVSALQVRDMLGLADRARVLDLLEAALAGDHARALSEMASLYDSGGDPAIITRDCLDYVHAITRVKAAGPDTDLAEAKETVQRLVALADNLSIAQLTRLWKILLVGLEDVRRAPDPLSAAEMTLLRLGSAASLPSPEDAAKMLRGEMEAAPSAPKSEPAPAPEPAPVAQMEVEAEPAAPLENAPASLDELHEAMSERADAHLRSDITRFVRPISFKPGKIVFEPAEHAPPDLAQRLAKWLQDRTGSTWAVLPTHDSRGGETIRERQKREEREHLERVARDPAIAKAMRLFPGAEIVSVTKPDTEDNEDGAAASAEGQS